MGFDGILGSEKGLEEGVVIRHLEDPLAILHPAPGVELDAVLKFLSWHGPGELDHCLVDLGHGRVAYLFLFG